MLAGTNPKGWRVGISQTLGGVWEPSAPHQGQGWGRGPGLGPPPHPHLHPHPHGAAQGRAGGRPGSISAPQPRCRGPKTRTRGGSRCCPAAPRPAPPLRHRPAAGSGSPPALLPAGGGGGAGRRAPPSAGLEPGRRCRGLPRALGLSPGRPHSPGGSGGGFLLAPVRPGCALRHRAPGTARCLAAHRPSEP